MKRFFDYLMFGALCVASTEVVSKYVIEYGFHTGWLPLKGWISLLFSAVFFACTLKQFFDIFLSYINEALLNVLIKQKQRNDDQKI